MNHQKLFFGTTLLALLFMAFALGLTSGQVDAPKKYAQSVSVSDENREFVAKAVKVGVTAVALGKLATTRSGSHAVRQFGKHIAKTHDHTNAELIMLAKAKGMMLPAADTDPQHQELRVLLKTVEGAEFDRLYIYGAALSNHIEAAALFEEQSINGHDPDLRDFAKRALSSIKKDLEIIRIISSQKSPSEKVMSTVIYI